MERMDAFSQLAGSPFIAFPNLIAELLKHGRTHKMLTMVSGCNPTRTNFPVRRRRRPEEHSAPHSREI